MACTEALAERPGTIISELFARMYESDTTPGLLDQSEVTPDAIRFGHRRLVKQELCQTGRYPLIEDTTIRRDAFSRE